MDNRQYNLNQNMDADKLSVVVARFVVGGWIMWRLGGEGRLFVQKKKNA